MNIKIFISICLWALCTLVFVNGCKHDPILFGNNQENQGGNTGPVNIDTVTFNINTKPCQSNIVYFNNQILPIFVSNCAISGCHDAQSSREEVVLTDYSHITRGIRAGDPNDSKYYRVLIASSGEDLMPRIPGTERGYSLPSDQIDLIKTWILQGAANNSCNSCDTTLYTFSGRIQSIIELNCAASSACHGQGSPNGSLTSYTSIKSFIDADLIQRRAIVYQDMPPASPLPDCERLLIKKWIDQGALNN